MFRPGMFRHLFLSFGLLTVFSVALLAFLVAGQTERNELASVEDRLLSEAVLVAQVVPALGILGGALVGVAAAMVTAPKQAS